MKSLFDQVSTECSKITTKKYSTSFSLGILFLNKRLRNSIYSIYGFVRFADEIVDSFHEYDKKRLFANFRESTYEAIENKISLNPILNSFQAAVHQYNIDISLIETFLDSMEMDLEAQVFTQDKYKKYILGSAEVVGLMCLCVFTEGDKQMFEKLKPFAMKLGAAFQKVNFLRDAKADSEELGRMYFPNVNLNEFSKIEKEQIEKEIEEDFNQALIGIRQLPASSSNGVHLAYYYYYRLFKKIKNLPPHLVLKKRIRIPNYQKILLMLKSNLKFQLNLF